MYAEESFGENDLRLVVTRTHTHTHVEIFIHSDMPVSDGARLGHVRERAKAGEKLMSSSCEV